MLTRLHKDVPQPGGRDRKRGISAVQTCDGVGSSAFADLVHAEAVLVAVSGGPDSMALLGLVAEWRQGRATPRLYAATVDHGLRVGSADEADLVARTAAALDVPHAVLPWVGPKPRTRIQELARDARYALLAAHAHRIGATILLTAHHADDQAETVLMRLGRGSGLRGLAGMRREHAFAPSLTLIRPLLDIPKRVLKDQCERLELPYVDDPTNVDVAFTRGRLRREHDKAASLGLHRHALTRVARRMQRAEDALAAETARVAALVEIPCGPGIWRGDLSAHVNLTPEIMVRVLERAITNVLLAKTEPSRMVQPFRLRLERLERLADEVHDACAVGRELRATLGGTRVIVARDGMVEVMLESPRSRGRDRRTKISVFSEACPAIFPDEPAKLGLSQLHLARARAKLTLAGRS